MPFAASFSPAHPLLARLCPAALSAPPLCWCGAGPDHPQHPEVSGLLDAVVNGTEGWAVHFSAVDKPWRVDADLVSRQGWRDDPTVPPTTVWGEVPPPHAAPATERTLTNLQSCCCGPCPVSWGHHGFCVSLSRCGLRSPGPTRVWPSSSRRGGRRQNSSVRTHCS